MFTLDCYLALLLAHCFQSSHSLSEIELKVLHAPMPKYTVIHKQRYDGTPGIQTLETVGDPYISETANYPNRTVTTLIEQLFL